MAPESLAILVSLAVVAALLLALLLRGPATDPALAQRLTDLQSVLDRQGERIAAVIKGDAPLAVEEGERFIPRLPARVAAQFHLLPAGLEPEPHAAEKCRIAALTEVAVELHDTGVRGGDVGVGHIVEPGARGVGGHGAEQEGGGGDEAVVVHECQP